MIYLPASTLAKIISPTGDDSPYPNRPNHGRSNEPNQPSSYLAFKVPWICTEGSNTSLLGAAGQGRTMGRNMGGTSQGGVFVVSGREKREKRKNIAPTEKYMSLKART